MNAPEKEHITAEAAVQRIKAALRRRSGRTWSVTAGRGTGARWLRITAPPQRRTGTMREYIRDGAPHYEHVDLGEVGHGLTPEDAAELAELLGLEAAQLGSAGADVAPEQRTEYVQRAEGAFTGPGSRQRDESPAEKRGRSATAMLDRRRRTLLAAAIHYEAGAVRGAAIAEALRSERFALVQRTAGRAGRNVELRETLRDALDLAAVDQERHPPIAVVDLLTGKAREFATTPGAPGKTIEIEAGR